MRESHILRMPVVSMLHLGFGVSRSTSVDSSKSEIETIISTTTVDDVVGHCLDDII
jgi:hypothetical protein